MIQDFCRLFSIRGYFKTLGVIPLMLCTTESHRLEVGAGIFLGLRTWFPEKGSSPGKGGRTARHMWRSVSLQSQATGHRQTAPRGPEETPGPPTCPLPSGLWVHCWPWAPLCGFKTQCRAGVSKTATFLLGMQLQLGLGMEERGKEEGRGIHVVQGDTSWVITGEAVPFLCWVPESAWPQGPVDPTALSFGPKGICESGTFPWETT